jgi:hypothetical protein
MLCSMYLPTLLVHHHNVMLLFDPTFLEVDMCAMFINTECESMYGDMEKCAQPSVDNHSDICTKVVIGGQKRYHLIRLIMYDLCD